MFFQVHGFGELSHPAEPTDRLRLVGIALRAGVNVVVSEPRIAWIQNPLPHLTSTADVVAQRDRAPRKLFESWGATFGTGLFAVRATPDTVRLFDGIARHKGLEPLAQQVRLASVPSPKQALLLLKSPNAAAGPVRDTLKERCLDVACATHRSALLQAIVNEALQDAGVTWDDPIPLPFAYKESRRCAPRANLHYGSRPFLRDLADATSFSSRSINKGRLEESNGTSVALLPQNPYLRVSCSEKHEAELKARARDAAVVNCWFGRKGTKSIKQALEHLGLWLLPPERSLRHRHIAKGEAGPRDVALLDGSRVRKVVLGVFKEDEGWVDPMAPAEDPEEDE